MVKAALAVIPFLLTSQVHSQSKPQELQGLIKSNHHYGKATLTWTFFDVYDISLWTDSTPWKPTSPYALNITYKMSFTTEDLLSKTVEEMNRLDGPKNTPSRFQDQLKRIFPSVKPGDQITAIFLPPAEVKFFYNSQPRGNITDSEFLKYFSDIWLSSKTSAPKVRDQLLKQNK